MVLPDASSRLMRRIATVTISAPLAACAARIASIEGYFPVPTINRDVKRYEPIVSASSTPSPSRDGADDLDAIAVL